METRSKEEALLSSLQGVEEPLDTLYQAALAIVEQYQCRIQVIAESKREEDGAVLRVTWDWEWAGAFNQMAIRILDVGRTPFYYPQAPNNDNGALRLLYWCHDAARLGWEKWQITSLSEQKPIR